MPEDSLEQSSKPVGEKLPGHVEAATVAGMQFILGIGIVLAVTLPTVFIVFVLWPMGRKGIFPSILTLIGLACLVQVIRVMMRKDPESFPTDDNDSDQSREP